MRCAIITGASSGLGAEYARQIPKIFPDIEDLWLVARRTELLEALASELDGVFVRCIGADLTSDEGLAELSKLLAESSREVALLINCAGCGYLGNVAESETDKQLRMVDLNVRGLTAVTSLVLPHMPRGGRIINLSSIASFVPNPRMTVYSSTKSYVSAFSRGLSEELRPRGISVTAVCPGPMDTEFLEIGDIKGNSKTFETLPYCDPVSVVTKSLNAAKSRRAVYTPRVLYKIYRVLSGIVPHALLVKVSKT